jgi:hypothetical protein
MPDLHYAATFSGSGFAGVSASAAQDLFDMLASSAVPFRVKRISISATGATSPADIVLSVQRFAATVTQGSGGSSITPVELSQVSGRSATTTCRANDTTRATTSGNTQLLWIGTMQELNNFDDVLVPELWPMIPANDALIIGLEVAPGTVVTLYGTVHFAELT